MTCMPNENDLATKDPYEKEIWVRCPKCGYSKIKAWTYPYINAPTDWCSKCNELMTSELKHATSKSKVDESKSPCLDCDLRSVKHCPGPECDKYQVWLRKQSRSYDNNDVRPATYVICAYLVTGSKAWYILEADSSENVVKELIKKHAEIKIIEAVFDRRDDKLE